MPGLLSMSVGPLGGGKTTRAVWKAQYVKQRWPWVPVIANLPITGCIYVPDIIRFLAVKLIKEGNLPGGQRTYMLVIIDEANTQGFESRGSGFSPGDTQLLQFARKLKVDIELISQLLSMIDKRGQWLAHFYILCKAIMNDDEVAHFEYKIYDQALDYQKTEYLEGKFCEKWVFPAFNTYDIPNYDEVALELPRRHKINSTDLEDYDRIVRNYADTNQVRPQDWWFGNKWRNFWDNVDYTSKVPVSALRNVNQEIAPIQPRTFPSSNGKSASDLLRG